MSVHTPEKFKVRAAKKRPYTVEAMRFVGSNVDAIAVYQWVEENTSGSFDVNSMRDPIPSNGVSIDAGTGQMVVATKTGLMAVELGDWVIKLVNGEFTVMSNRDFHDTYSKEGK
jgi:hypothetical protein